MRYLLACVCLAWIWQSSAQTENLIQGCTHPEACNYSPNAQMDDGSCQMPLFNGDCLAGAEACSESAYWNPILQECISINPFACPGDLNGDGAVSTSDLLNLLTYFGSFCPATGCTDTYATNYDSTAVVNDGSCLFPPCIDPLEPGLTCDDGDPNSFNDMYVDGCTCTGSPAVNPDGSGPCEAEESISYHNHDYLLVEIGDQCWFRENLQTLQFNNGDSIPYGTATLWNSSVWQNLSFVGPAAAPYLGYEPNRNHFGALYNHHAVTDTRGLCPSGWHVPSDEEWIQLAAQLGVDSTQLYSTDWAGSNVAISDQIRDPSYANGTNSSGFSALAAGTVDPWGSMVQAQTSAHFWTSTLDGGLAWDRRLSSQIPNAMRRYASDERAGLSVRCLRNVANEVVPGTACDDGNTGTYNDIWDESGSNCSGTAAVAADGSGPCEAEGSISYHDHDYLLVEIGDQCWFRENLQTLQFNNGDSIPYGTATLWSSSVWRNLSFVGPAAAPYLGYEPNLNHFGALYNHHAVTDTRGLCPSGWHVPSDEEWIQLAAQLGVDSTQLYSTDWAGSNVDISDQIRDPSFANGTNSSGFSALAAGTVDTWGSMVQAQTSAHFWTSTLDGGLAWDRRLSSQIPNAILRYTSDQRAGLSVRCLMDNPD